MKKAATAPLHLIPPPKRLRSTGARFALPALREILVPADLGAPGLDTARQLATEIGLATGHEPLATVHRISTSDTPAIVLGLARLPSPEHYRLRISPRGIDLRGGGAPGLFYAAQTLIQIVRQADRRHTIPTLTIDDGPDYPSRGLYHDISRGKVPTRATLLALIEKLAHYKINHLQLYIEHTYAFARHPDIWAGADPLTADDIRALDEHAARHHIDLVPSLSCFGHFYTALVSPRKQHLNELPIDAARLPFSWWDRMGHYTLDCCNPESLRLVRELILELRPLFRSRYFNICCDETFDLGKGRNAAHAARHGTGRLYLDFLNKLIRIVHEADATPMFWGDIVGNHPELVSRVRRPAIALDWDYSADLRDTKARLFKKAKLPFHICPGVSGWDRWINGLDTATENILRFARHGRRHRAAGLLNTDWGDRGHINCLGNSFHGFLLGAAAAWNTNGTAADAFDAAFARLELGDRTGRATALMRDAARQALVSWREFTFWLDPTPHHPTDSWDPATGLPAALLDINPRRAFAAADRLERIRDRFARLVPPGAAADPLAREEFLFGCHAQAVSNRLGAWLVCLARNKPAPKNAPPATAVADDLRRLEADFSPIWHARNRPSEYWRIKTTLLELARRLDFAALHHT
ncbi:MAG: hypothetical protein D6781_03125, partial [Verrucomicrobia bacterium]